MEPNKLGNFYPLLLLSRDLCVACILSISVMFASSAWAHDYNALPPPNITLPSSFIEFRDNLEEALAAKDVKILRSFLAKDIKYGFGGSFGPDQFAADLGLDNSNGEGWGLLTHLISTDPAKIDLDGADAFILPYTAEMWPEADDPFNIVIGDVETKLRTLPSGNGRVASTLKYPILKIKSEIRDSDWFEVEASNGIWGYIPKEKTVEFLGYRMMIENNPVDGEAKWQITFVGAGD